MNVCASNGTKSKGGGPLTLDDFLPDELKQTQREPQTMDGFFQFLVAKAEQQAGNN